MTLRSRVLLLILTASGLVNAEIQQPLPVPKVSRESPLWNAVEAYRNGWKSTAAELAAPLAEKGNTEALFLMGLTKENQQPARQSRGQAISYFYRKAAAAGYTEAAMRGLLVPLGSNVESEKSDARATLEAAAGKNDATAQKLLAEGWLRGFVDSTPNFATAREWWEKAAKSGDTTAMVQLGKLLDGTYGFTESRDPQAALGYYEEANRLGDDSVLIPLGQLLLGDDQAVRNEAEGLECLNRAAERGVPQARLILGEYDLKIKKDAEAMEQFNKGADAGDSRCMLKIAIDLLAKSGSDTAGLTWLKKAAEAGNPEAAANLGQRLVKEDAVKGARYLLQAANEGLPKAQYDIAMLYLDGGLGYRDPASAVAWLTEGMKSGDAQTQYKLATLHEQGIGCPVNYSNAGVLYTMASNKGIAAASGRIAFLSAEGLGTKASLSQAWAYASLAIERGDEASKDFFAAIDAKMDPTEKEQAAKILSGLKTSPVKPLNGLARPK